MLVYRASNDQNAVFQHSTRLRNESAVSIIYLDEFRWFTEKMQLNTANLLFASAFSAVSIVEFYMFLSTAGLLHMFLSQSWIYENAATYFPPNSAPIYIYTVNNREYGVRGLVKWVQIYTYIRREAASFSSIS